MVLGFTGTQRGMTEDQFIALQEEVVKATRVGGYITLHHGDCIGADAQMHCIAHAMEFSIVVHPPLNPAKRAYADSGIYRGVTVRLPPKEYLERNHDIVDACDVLLAAPSGPEATRSGTWATIRYARRTGTPVVIIYPDGGVEK